MPILKPFKNVFIDHKRHFVEKTLYKRENWVQSYSKLDLPGAPQSAHWLLDGRCTSSMMILVFLSFAIFTQSRRLFSPDRAAPSTLGTAQSSTQPEMRLVGREKRNLPSSSETSDRPTFAHRQAAPRSRERSLLTPLLAEERQIQVFT